MANTEFKYNTSHIYLNEAIKYLSNAVDCVPEGHSLRTTLRRQIDSIRGIQQEITKLHRASIYKENIYDDDKDNTVKCSCGEEIREPGVFICPKCGEKAFVLDNKTKYYGGNPNLALEAGTYRPKNLFKKGT